MQKPTVPRFGTPKEHTFQPGPVLQLENCLVMNL